MSDAPDLDELIAETTRRQSRAADPESSAWVAANAGSGKTKVLTDRVMRLLLAGNAPDRLLCITFTKAAAAEMADRLFTRLGEWALMPDEKLSQTLERLDGRKRQDAQELSEARRLFARALETPGGLKIQTIHAFCERVLKRFPLEARIPPGFSVAEEGEARELVDGILDTLAERLWTEREAGGEDAWADFDLLTGALQEDAIRKHVAALVAQGPEIATAIDAAGGEQAFFHQLAGWIGAEPDSSRDDIIMQLRADLSSDHDWLDSIIYVLSDSNEKNAKKAAHLMRMLSANDNDAYLEAACAFALKVDGGIDKRWPAKALDKIVPGLVERLKQIAERIESARTATNAQEIFEKTRALYRLALFVIDQYRDIKLRRGLLDFDDLIVRTAALFGRDTGLWALYKLDRGLDHILVDEAQDTSAAQWRVIEGPLAEFFAGEGAAERLRTLFVVGDEKQSIYSFQGADVGLFTEKQGTMQELVSTAGHDFGVETLDVSFRSCEPVLRFVDELFADPAAQKGVSEAAIRHFAHRRGAAGLVELWPLIEREKAEKDDPWDAPVDTPGPADPSTRLAGEIAATIDGWLKDGEPLPSKDRHVRPGDILILCQRRGALFHEIVRQLIARGVPTAGSDRIRLMEHPAALDLLAATRFCLLPRDDLSLAELLKSPLFAMDEETLFELAHDRDGSLWQALRARAKADPDGPFGQIAATLETARTIGLSQGPYAFYTHLLETGMPSGWERFYKRLGRGARDAAQEVLNEALSWEAGNPRSLQGFLFHLEGLDTDLKKELGGEDDLVRIMTVHGAKGLEAPIVFMADAAHANYADIKGLMPIGPVSGIDASPQAETRPGCFILPPAKPCDTERTALARAGMAGRAAEEYRRLLYVAATRAEDRLYICGTLGGNARRDKFLDRPGDDCSWYALAHRAFRRLAAEGAAEEGPALSWSEQAPAELAGGPALRLSCPQVAEPKREEAAAAPDLPPLPACLTEPAPAETAPPRISPSHLATEREEDDAPTGTAATPDSAYAPTAQLAEGMTPYTRGNALHLLLERLAELPDVPREEVGRRLLARHYPQCDALHGEWLAETLAVIRDPAFADAFAPGSRAEVPLIGKIGDRIVSGQIDRLHIAPQRVLIVDYKTNRPPPDRLEDVPRAYTLQLAAYRGLLQEIYPEHEIVCALLWTWAARLMEIPPAMLDHALLHWLPAPEKS